MHISTDLHAKGYQYACTGIGDDGKHDDSARSENKYHPGLRQVVSVSICHKLDPKKEALQAGRKLYEAGKRTLDIPIQLSELMRMMTKGRIKLNLEIMDSSVPRSPEWPLLVNKLVVGIVVHAVLLMASSLICTTDMTPKVLGIPAIGFIGYMTAVFLGMWLLYTVLKDKRR